MWFADVGLYLGWALLAGWLLVTVLAPIVAGGRLPRLPMPVLAGAGAAAALFTAQAVVVDRVEDIPGVGPLDHSVLIWFVGHRAVDTTEAMITVSGLGGTASMTVLAAVAVIVLWWVRRRHAAAVVAAAAIGAGLLVEGFKNLYARPRPPVMDRLVPETSFSLPSGHALGSMVVLGVLAAAVVVLVSRRLVQVTAVVVAVSGIVTIGVSRLYLGVHWATDVLTGWLLGGAWLALCITALVVLDAHPTLRSATTRRRNVHGADGPATDR